MAKYAHNFRTFAKEMKSVQKRFANDPGNRENFIYLHEVLVAAGKSYPEFEANETFASMVDDLRAAISVDKRERYEAFDNEDFANAIVLMTEAAKVDDRKISLPKNFVINYSQSDIVFVDEQPSEANENTETPTPKKRWKPFRTIKLDFKKIKAVLIGVIIWGAIAAAVIGYFYLSIMAFFAIIAYLGVTIFIWKFIIGIVVAFLSFKIFSWIVMLIFSTITNFATIPNFDY